MSDFKMKQIQHHGRRAPHGKPEKTVRVSFRCTPAQRRKVQRKGGSLFLRALVDEA